MRSEIEIINQTKALARTFYEKMGYKTDSDFNFRDSTHPQERLMWELACMAQEALTHTDVEDCILNMDEE